MTRNRPAAERRDTSSAVEKGSMLGIMLNHLEEWIITFLIGAATL